MYKSPKQMDLKESEFSKRPATFLQNRVHDIKILGHFLWGSMSNANIRCTSSNNSLGSLVFWARFWRDWGSQKVIIQSYIINIYIYGNYIWIYGLLNKRTGILDYLRECFSWLAGPFKHTETNSFKHTVTTLKYTNWYFILPPGPRGLARPPHI